MVLNAEKRARLVEVLSLCDDAAAGAGTSAPTAPPATQTTPGPPSIQTTPVPASSAPLAAIPLATVWDSPPPAPLEEGEGVVNIASDDEEASLDGPVFKRRRAATTTTSHSSSAGRPASFSDNPPSASSPRGPLALEGGGESVPEPAPDPAPELPLVLQQILKGY